MIDPAKFASKEQTLDFECYNNYDGAHGRLSEIPVEPFCINQCTAPSYGKCQKGACMVSGHAATALCFLSMVARLPLRCCSVIGTLQTTRCVPLEVK